MTEQTQETIPVEAPKAEAPVEEKTLTQADFAKALAKRTAEINAKFEAEANAKLEAFKKEQELSKMSEADKNKTLLEEAQKKVQTLESEFKFSEQKTKVISLLNEKKLNVSFADFLIVKHDDEATNRNIEAFQKEFNDAVLSGVNERIQPHTPKIGIGSGTLDDFEEGFNR